MAVLGSLTVLPALLCRLGDSVERLPRSVRRPAPQRDGRGRFWSAIVDRVMRRPVLCGPRGGLLVAAGDTRGPAATADGGAGPFRSRWPWCRPTTASRTPFPARAARERRGAGSRRGLAGGAGGDRGAEEQALASGQMHKPITVDVNADGTVANVSDPARRQRHRRGLGRVARRAAATIVPETVGAVARRRGRSHRADRRVDDLEDEIKSELPGVFAFVLLFAFVLMLVAFRSLVIAAKAIVLNLLSVAAAYGVLVARVPARRRQGLLGFSTTAGIDPVDAAASVRDPLRPLDGLPRVHPQPDPRGVHRGMSSDEAIAYGIRSTAGVVTSAAIVMVLVFAVFATLSMLVLQAVRRRARGCRPARRDHRPRGAPARVDEAARRLELVPAELARVAAARRRSGRRDRGRSRRRPPQPPGLRPGG